MLRLRAPRLVLPLLLGCALRAPGARPAEPQPSAPASPSNQPASAPAPRAASTAAAGGDARSKLEQSAVAEALAHFGWREDRSPEGKEIEQVEVYVLPVFDKRDPIPDFLNALHVSSQAWVIEQEVLVEPGGRWEVGRVLETERNLRSLRQLSLANVVAAEGSTPEKVRVVVVVKDVWSLRVNTNFAFGTSGLDYLLINPAEENLAGLHLNLGLLYLLERDRHSFGARFVYPRIAGSRFWVAGDATVSTNRHDGELEGSAGSFLFMRPLYSRHTRWAYGAEVAWRFELTRRYQGSELRQFEYVSPAGVSETIPEIYETDRLAADYFGLRSFGVEWKYDLSFGLELDHRRYRGNELEGYSAAAVAAFEEEVLPVSDRRVDPYVQLRSYRTRFHRVLDLEILGLQEDWRLGHEALTRVYAGAQGLASTRDHLGCVAGVGYTLPVGDGLARAVALSDVVVTPDGKNEGYLAGHARLASPFVVFGRLHLDAIVAHRYLNYLNVAPFALGGNGRLRGYASDEFRGRDLLALNAELRTGSLDVRSAQVGLAAFFDAGDTPEELADLDLKLATGLGLRILFPQAERRVLRLDWALPLSRAEPLPGGFFVTFGQAFGMPSLSAQSVTRGLSLF